MFHRTHRKVPGLNTTSTADISFMLLILFLVTSSMDTDKGLPTQLPPPPTQQLEQEVAVKERNVMTVRLDGHDRLTVGGQPLTPDELRQRVIDFVANEHDDPSLPEKSRRELHLIGTRMVSDRHVISIEADRQASYDAYFQMRNAVVAAYNELRNRMALSCFHHPYAQCSADERDVLALCFPQRVSETVVASGPDEEGGQP